MGYVSCLPCAWHVYSLCDHSRKAIPTGVTTGLDIGLSNLSLKLITLSFYSKSACLAQC